MVSRNRETLETLETLETNITLLPDPTKVRRISIAVVNSRSNRFESRCWRFICFVQQLLCVGNQKSTRCRR